MQLVNPGLYEFIFIKILGQIDSKHFQNICDSTSKIT